MDLKNFKPEFGNKHHLQILEMLGRLEKKKAVLKQKKQTEAVIKKLLLEIKKDEQNIEYAIAHKDI